MKVTFISVAITVLFLTGCAAESIEPKAASSWVQPLIQAKLTESLVKTDTGSSFNITNAQEITISKSHGKEAMQAIYTDQSRIEAIAHAINTAEQLAGILNTAAPDYVVTITRQIEKHTFNLWISGNNEQGMIMDVQDTHKGYALTPEATNKLLQIIQEDTQLKKRSTIIMPITFEKVQNDQKVVKVDHIEMAELLKEQEIAGGKISVFSKPGDSEQVYGAFESEAGIL